MANNYTVVVNGRGFWLGSLPDRKKPILAVPNADGTWTKVASFDGEDKFTRFIEELSGMYGEAQNEENVENE